MSMGFKRFFLSIGMALIALSLVITGMEFNNLRFIRSATATMTEYIGSDDQQNDWYAYEFDAGGKTVTRSVFTEFADEPYEEGKQFKVDYDVRNPEVHVHASEYWNMMLICALPLFIIGAVIIYLTRKSIRGYFRGYILKHPVASLVTVISLIPLVQYFYWYHFVYEPIPTNYDGLGQAIMMLLLCIAVPPIILVTWIIALTIEAGKESREKRKAAAGL